MPRGGECVPRGGGCMLRGVSAQGVSAQEGVCPGGVCRGVSAGVSAVPPVDRIFDTRLVKILPCRNFVADRKN